MPSLPRAGRFVVVLITCPSSAVGEKIGRALVEAQAAACVNIVSGVRSIYRWKGKVCREAEVLLVVKTRRTKVPVLLDQVKRLHPAAVPEVIALPIVAGSEPYLAWVRDSTRAAAP